MMDEELEREIRAFLTSLKNECSNCLRHNSVFCDNCYSRRAKIILDRMAFRPQSDVPAPLCDIVSRMARIAAILKRANRPMLAVEIEMADTCSRSLKEFTLREMVRLGKISRHRVRNSPFYLYSLKPQKKG